MQRSTPPERWNVPTPLETVRVQMADGAPIALRRHGNPSGPRMVLSHGNALAADLYYPFWSLLMDRFDIMLYDIRSHGWNPVWDRQTHNFPTFVSDSQSIAREIDAHFGAKPQIGVFHSMSALIALLHQLQGESGFAALVLLDVPICPSRNTPEDNLEIGYTMGERARQRTVKFASLEDFSESLRRSRTFQRLQPGVIELFSQTTLRPDGDGGYELRCPREYEAQVCDYYFGWTMQAYEEMERLGLSCPAKAIGADPTVPFSFLPGIKLGTLSMMDYDFIPDSTHFLPLEFSQECATMTTEFLEEHGLI